MSDFRVCRILYFFKRLAIFSLKISLVIASLNIEISLYILVIFITAISPYSDYLINFKLTPSHRKNNVYSIRINNFIESNITGSDYHHVMYESSFLESFLLAIRLPRWDKIKGCALAWRRYRSFSPGHSVLWVGFIAILKITVDRLSVRDREIPV